MGDTGNVGRRRKRKLPPGIEAHGQGYRAQVTIDGKRDKSRTVYTIEEAARLRDQMKRWRPGAGVLRLADAMDLLRDDLARKGTSEHTRHYYEEQFKTLLDAWDETTPLARIDARAIEAFERIRREQHGVAPSTVAKNIGTLRRLFRLAIKRRRETGIVENPIDEITMPRVRHERFPHLTEAEVKAFVQRIRATDLGPRGSAPWEADVVLMFFLTGVRRMEAGRVAIEHADVFRSKLHVRGKCGDRTLPIAPALKPVLSRLIADAQANGRDYLIPGEHEQRRAERITAICNRWSRRLGRRLTPHMLRHSFATWHVDNGTPPHVLQQLMGHATLAMTMRYYHANDADARAAMERISSAFEGDATARAQEA